MKRKRIRAALLCALLFLALWRDTLGLLRLTLLCAALHEAGHILAYRAVCGAWPALRLGMGGAALQCGFMGRDQEAFVVCAGPCTNFLCALLALALIQAQASYGAYAFAAVNLCTGCYNLLPLGMLDGARLLQLCLPARLLPLADAAEQLARTLVCAAGVTIALAARTAPGDLRLAALLAAGYLAMGTRRS